MTVLPALLLTAAHLWVLAATIPVIFFFLWNPGLLNGETQVPARSHYLLAAAALLNLVWFLVGWGDGLHYQGVPYTHAVLAINVAWVVVLTASMLISRKKNSFASNLIFHWFLFAWLGWFAFPYLGELP